MPPITTSQSISSQKNNETKKYIWLERQWVCRNEESQRTKVQEQRTFRQLPCVTRGALASVRKLFKFIMIFLLCIICTLGITFQMRFVPFNIFRSFLHKETNFAMNFHQQILSAGHLLSKNRCLLIALGITGWKLQTNLTL